MCTDLPFGIILSLLLKSDTSVKYNSDLIGFDFISVDEFLDSNIDEFKYLLLYLLFLF